jgi:hypothetical protein
MRGVCGSFAKQCCLQTAAKGVRWSSRGGCGRSRHAEHLGTSTPASSSCALGFASPPARRARSAGAAAQAPSLIRRRALFRLGRARQSADVHLELPACRCRAARGASPASPARHAPERPRCLSAGCATNEALRPPPAVAAAASKSRAQDCGAAAQSRVRRLDAQGVPFAFLPACAHVQEARAPLLAPAKALVSEG